MRAIVCSLAMALVMLTACAHVSTVEHPSSEVLDSYQRTSEPKGKRTILANCEETTDTRLFCSFSVKDRCDVSDIDLTAEYVTYENSTSHWIKALEWVATGAVFGVGLTVTIDAGSLPDGSNPLDSNPVGQAGAYAIGGSLLAAAVGLGTWATIDSLRAMDETKEVARKEVTRAVKEIDCGEHLLANTKLEIHSAKTFAKVDTDAQGHVTIALDKLIPYDKAVDPKIEPVYSFKLDGKVCFEGRAERYFAMVREKERIRLADLEDRRKEIGETNRMIDALLQDAQGAACLHWWDSHSGLQDDPRTYPRMQELQACAVRGQGQHCHWCFKQGELDKGSTSLLRLRKMMPGYEGLPPLVEMQKAALSKKFDDRLRAFHLQVAKTRLEQCAELFPGDAMCSHMKKRWDLSEVLLGLQNGEPGMKGALVVVFEGRKQAKKQIGNLSKRFILRSGGIKDLEWIPAAKIAGVFPDEDPKWQQECLADDSCAVGVLRQLNASFLLALEIDERKQKSQLKVSLIQPLGGILDRRQEALHDGEPRRHPG